MIGTEAIQGTSGSQVSRFSPNTEQELRQAVDYYCEYKTAGKKRYGDIGTWDVSKITDMNQLFSYKYFNEDISRWDVSNVTNMLAMFYDSTFNQPLDNWNVGNIKDKVCLL
jgi:hypothetical protein